MAKVFPSWGRNSIKNIELDEQNSVNAIIVTKEK